MHLVDYTCDRCVVGVDCQWILTFLQYMAQFPDCSHHTSDFQLSGSLVFSAWVSRRRVFAVLFQVILMRADEISICRVRERWWDCQSTVLFLLFVESPLAAGFFSCLAVVETALQLLPIEDDCNQWYRWRESLVQSEFQMQGRNGCFPLQCVKHGLPVESWSWEFQVHGVLSVLEVHVLARFNDFFASAKVTLAFLTDVLRSFFKWQI